MLLLRIGVGLAVALPLGLFSAMSWMAYRDAERAAGARLDSLTRVMEEHAERALETNAMVFEQVERVLGAATDARIRAREPQLAEFLGAISDRLPHLRSIAIRGTQGEVLAASAPPDATSYRIRQGRVELELDAAHFTHFYRRLAKPEAEITFRLVSARGEVVAAWPAAASAAQRDYSASRVVGEHALFVSASQPRHVVFAPWHRQLAVLAAIAVPSALALFYASLIALRRTRRLQEEMASRVRVEEALRHSQKMEALGELTGGVAHDFANLLGIVANSAHLLALTVPQTRDSAALASIRKAVESGSRLTRQLLTFARRQPLNPQLVELQRALPGMVELLKSTAGSGVALGLHVAPDTPPVEVDPAELEMALINLVANARDAMERSGNIEILARGEHGRAVISVSDTGHGIAAENLQRVFEPFFTTKPPGSGTGLGLSQVYGFCHQAGGSVQLESDLGVGTTVSLLLPASAKRALALTKAPRLSEAQPA